MPNNQMTMQEIIEKLVNAMTDMWHGELGIKSSQIFIKQAITALEKMNGGCDGCKYNNNDIIDSCSCLGHCRRQYFDDYYEPLPEPPK